MNKMTCIRWSITLLMTLCTMTACGSKPAEPEITAPSTTVSETSAENATEMSTSEPDLAKLETYIAANTGKELLNRHRSFSYTCAYFQEDQDKQETVSETTYLYYDADIVAKTQSSGIAMFANKTQWVNRELDDEGLYYLQWLFESEETAASVFESVRDAEQFYLAEQEKVVKTIDKGDGLFIAVSEIADADHISERLDLDSAYYAYEYSEGMKMQFVYTLDTKTLDLVSIDTHLIDADGTSHRLEEYTYKYDEKSYDPTAEGEPFEEYTAAMQDPEKTRTITITYAPNTENEQVEDYVLPHNVSFCAYYKGDYVQTYYTDPACTQEFEGSDGKEDLTLYVSETGE